MEISLSIDKDNSDIYRIIISSIDTNILPQNIIDLFYPDIEIADITLERTKGENKTKLDVLLKISAIIAGILEENQNLILYFYCDDRNDIPRRNSHESPQRFRSRLFSTMFDKYVQTHHEINFINTPINIRSNENDIYIHLISRKSQVAHIEGLKNFLINDLSK